MAELLLSSRQVAWIDSHTQEEIGIPGAVLMENAGRSLWEQFCALVPDVPAGNAGLVICAGRGNNGGDALVSGRYAFAAGLRPRIITLTAKLGKLAAQQWQILENIGVTRLIWEEQPEECALLLQESQWVMDGVLGTGLTGAPREPALSLIRAITASLAAVVAVDVPSGISDSTPTDADTVFSDITICTGPRRIPLYSEALRHRCGTIWTVDPGFPPAVVARSFADDPVAPPQLESPADVLRRNSALLTIPRNAHKGTRGTIGVIGGGVGTTGAPVLAGRGALAAGAGMVRICGPASALAPAAIMTVPDSPTARDELVRWARGLVIGPGWVAAKPDDLYHTLLQAVGTHRPVVVDASALRLLPVDLAPELSTALAGAPVVFTPHPGEMAHLTGRSVEEVQSQPEDAIRNVQERWPVTVILKGSVVWVASPGTAARVIDGRCPALATAGSGDILAGVVAALVLRAGAHGYTPMEITEAALTAVALHLRAGEQLFTGRGWFIADDLVDAIAREAGNEYR